MFLKPVYLLHLNCFETSSTALSHATPADSVFILSTAILNKLEIFLFEFIEIPTNISGIGSYVNFILDLNMFNAFFNLPTRPI